MKQHFKMAALSLAVISSTNAFAQDSSEPEYKNWFGLSGMYYNTDDSRPLDLTDGGLYDDGRGVAFEYGFRFTQSWAARVEFTALDLDYAGGGDESGEMVGVDALYFMPNDAWFVFGGVKRQAVGESTTLGNIGIGKHWDIHEDVKLVTEIAAYHDFGEDYNDYSVKVGIAIPFGKGTPAAPKDSDNDGVVDSKDQCPMTPAGVRVDANGCSIDDDNDGVLNNVDQCPNTPAGTKVDATGCAIKDSDNDGVVDSKDMCPDTPAGVKVDAKGCTVFDGGTPLGISVRERSVDANNPNGFKQYDTIRVITKGPIFADAPVAVTAGDPVYVLDADGTFHNAAAAGRTLYPGAVWDTTTTGAGLAVIALDIR